jgi:hypothetical protein
LLNSLSYATGSFSAMSDFVNSSFRKRQGKGEVFFSDMSSLTTTLVDGGGSGPEFKQINAPSCTMPVLNTEFKYEGNWLARWVPGTSVDGLFRPNGSELISDKDIQKLRTLVSTSVLNKRGRMDSNLFESLAELDQTIRLLDLSKARLTELLTRARRDVQQLGVGRTAQSRAAALWLTYRYGVRPILSDIAAILKSLEKMAGRKERLTVRSAERISLTRRTEGTIVNGNLTWPYSVTSNDIVNVRGMALDEVQLSRLEMLGFTGRGLLTLPWELFTLSFVADWLANVGDFIGSIAPAPGWNMLGSAMTIDRLCQTTYTGGAGFSNNPTVYQLTKAPSGSFRVETHTKSRIPLDSPGVVIRNDFRFDNFTRSADGFALLAVLFPKVFRALSHLTLDKTRKGWDIGEKPH